MNKVQKILGVLVVSLFSCVVFPNFVSATEYEENLIKRIAPDGKNVTIKAIKPKNDEEVFRYINGIAQTMLNEESKVPMLKKVVVASGNKVAIGNNLKEALKNLLSKEASNIEVENTDDIDGLIDSIVKANKNLSESTSNNDWELMGSDIKKLQSLINSLEELKDKEDKKKQEQENNTDSNSLNEVLSNEIVE